MLAVYVPIKLFYRHLSHSLYELKLSGLARGVMRPLSRLKEKSRQA